jgi:hypothetical protein
MADQVAAIIGDLARYTEAEVVGLAFDITATLRETTPRKTGWAAANWVPSIGVPAPPVPALASEATPADVARAAQQSAAAQAQLASYTMAEGPVFCTNGVPYIRRLNDGWSAQAPAAFIQAAIIQAVAQRAQR